MHYYQHHIGDFIKATARLTDAQSMAYLRLLWMYYDTEKPLKPDTKLLAFQIGTTEQETNLILNSFFTLTDRGWMHTRCEEEIAQYHSFLEKKSNAGKASAERRKNNRSTGVEQVLNSSSTNHITTNHITNKPTKNKTAPMPDGMDAVIWNDWLVLRKNKKAAVTDTAIRGIEREAAKAGIGLEQALKICCERGWAGFEASWILKPMTKGEQRQSKNVEASLKFLEMVK